MKPEKRQFGFWRVVARTSIGQVVGLEGVAAVLLGTGGGLWLSRVTSQVERTEVTGDLLAIGTALIGVIFAAFALVVALLSDSYLLLLAHHPNGAQVFMAPFMINIGILVAVVISTVAYRAAAANMATGFEKAYFVALCTLSVYAILNIVALARSVLAHGVTRAEHAKIIALENLNSEHKKRSQQEA